MGDEERRARLFGVQLSIHRKREMWALTVFILAVFVQSSYPLDNGLARTPPMGWMSWERYRCVTDCKTWPKSCISEDLYVNAGKALVKLGFKDAGYEYVSIDDCWASKTRDPKTKQLVGDPERFPHGMAYIGEQLHKLGLKYGIYGDIGTYTCGGYPGSEGHLALDAFTIANWGVDMLKLDGCYESTDIMNITYPSMATFLNFTERPILYLCSWPAYVVGQKIPQYELIAKYCNAWRNYGDIQDSWGSVKSIIDWYSVHWPEIRPFHGPGHFSDADMIIIGNFALSLEESKTQMAMWSMWSAPLILSTDLDTLYDWEINILQNKHVIAINQDALGEMATVVYKKNNMHIWHKNLFDGCEAVSFLNLNDDGMPRFFNKTLKELGLTKPAKYEATEVFDQKKLGTFSISDYFPIKVDIHGVQLLKFCPAKKTRLSFIAAEEQPRDHRFTLL